MMKLYLIDWLSVSLKLLHVIAGIAWIGASFYFNWLENKLNRVKNRDEIAGHLWAVHGGGFYYLEKYKKYPQTLPEPLHWFKWEAYVTWISGILLLSVIYYFNASTYLLASESSISSTYGILSSLLGLLIFWLIYDLLCKSKLVNKSSIFIGIIFVVISLSAYLYSNIFNPRAVYMQIGAMIGTVMVANVFFVIIPVQKKLVAACENSTEVSKELGLMGYTRSRHNNYFTLPVIFMMISGHYPTIYSGEYGWLVLIAIVGILVMIRHYFNLRGVGQAKKSLIALIVVSVLALIYALAPSQSQVQNQEAVNIEEVQLIIEKHCVSCHASEPSSAIFAVAPNGFMLDTKEQIIKQKNQIYQQAVISKAMPLGNATNMTDEERDKLKVWAEAE
ncbi:MAG: urate hydroxylase PuuD [Pseudomonadota bacterium]|nr:urate hydroxylase PuuD [Pseudomonadota bacterium]